MISKITQYKDEKVEESAVDEIKPNE